MSDLFVDNIKHQSSQGSGTITLGASGEKITTASGAEFSAVTGHMYPAFEAYKNSDQTVTDNATVKITWDTTEIDTDSAFDTTNNKFVVPTGKAGKYYIYGNLLGRSTTAKQVQDMRIMIYKNGSLYKTTFHIFSANIGDYIPVFCNAMMSLSAGDEIEIYTYLNIGSGTAKILGNTDRRSWFGGYRLGA